VFARLADAGAERTRAIEGQATLLGRTMHGIAYDAVHDEIIVPQQFGQAILTFAGDATGETPPKRVIRGSKTQLIALDRVGVDPVNNEIHVPDGDMVLVFPREGNGNVAPSRILRGPDTRIGDAQSVAIDPVRNLLIVASALPAGPEADLRGGGGRRRNELTIFARTASGNAKPKRFISGMAGGGNIAFDQPSGLIFSVQAGHIGVWSVEDEGNAPPRYTIGGPNGVLRSPRGVTLDPKNKTVIVSDKHLNAVLTFHVPQIFDAPTEPHPRRYAFDWVRPSLMALRRMIAPREWPAAGSGY